MSPCLRRKTFAVPPLGCNCSIIWDTRTKKGVVVDPGGNPEHIIQEITSLELTITGILHTHAHFDHFLASGILKDATRAPLGLCSDDAKLWDMLEIQCQLFGVPFVPVPPPDWWLRDEEVLTIGSLQGMAIHTPGHTPGSLCFHFPEAHVLLSGDTLFRGGIGRTDLWGGDSQAIEHSIRERIYTLPPDTQVVPGHGPETQIEFEQAHNPFVQA